MSNLSKKKRPAAASAEKKQLSVNDVISAQISAASRELKAVLDKHGVELKVSHVIQLTPKGH
jgi:hypothetical protein